MQQLPITSTPYQSSSGWWDKNYHELKLLNALLVDDDKKMIHQHATTVLEPCLKDKENGKSLEEHERRLLGQLAYKQLKCENRISLPSFPRYTKFDIVQVPTTKAQRNFEKSNQTRLNRTHLAVAQKWMDHLPGKFSDILIVSYIKKKRPCNIQ